MDGSKALIAHDIVYLPTKTNRHGQIIQHPIIMRDIRMTNKKCAVLAIHGQGMTKSDFADELYKQIQNKLGNTLRDQVYFGQIYYQGLIQGNQEVVWKSMPQRELRWKSLREFMLYGFSDPVTIEYAASGPDSRYLYVQRIIVEAIHNARKQLTDANSPIVIIADSLGGHLISNYIWDAQSQAKGKSVIGVWHYDLDSLMLGIASEEVDFYRLRTLRHLLTTGCNIPIFVAGHKDIVAIEKPNPLKKFDWLNFYDRDDILGWPLKPLSPSYDLIVTEDIDVDSGPAPSSWSPFSHLHYWKNEVFLNRAAQSIKMAIET